MSWLTEGAPVGILSHPVKWVEQADFMDPANGEFGDPAERMSYAFVEENDYAFNELDRLCAAGFIKKFATLDLCTEFLGCVQIRDRHQRETIWHQALIGTKESGVTRCARRNQRTILSHVLDVVFDALTLGDDGSFVEVLVLDVSDAFWTLPTLFSGAALFRGTRAA